MTSPGGIALSAVLWLLVLIGPAAVAVGWRRATDDWAAVLGSGPLLSVACLGLMRGASEITAVASHPLAVIGALCGAGVVARAVNGRQVPAPAHHATVPHTRTLAVVLAASGAAWFVISARGGISLGWVDGPRHGYFIDRIIDGGDATAATVLRHDPAVAEPVSRYYPLSLHLGAASMARLAGQSVADVVGGLGVVVCGVVLPAGWAALLRRITSDRHAVVTALIASFGSVWPWFGWSLGWMPFVAGLCLMPGALMLIHRSAAGEHRAAVHRAATHGAATKWRNLAMAAVAMAGVLSTHLGAWCVVLLAAFCIGGFTPRALGRVLLAVGSGLVVVAPETWAIAAGVFERHAVVSPTDGIEPATVVAWMTGQYGAVIGSVPLVLLALVGARSADRPLRLWCVVAFSLGGLGVALAAFGDGPVHLLAAPWNADASRLVLAQYALLPPLAAVAVCHVWQRNTARARAPRLTVACGAAAMAMILVEAADGAGSLTASPSASTQAVMVRAAEAGAGQVLAGYSLDGGLWLSTLAGPPPALGWPPEFVDPPASWSARVELGELLASPSTSAELVRDRAQSLCITSVLVVDRATAIDHHYPFDRRTMRNAPFLTEVVDGSDASLFSIDGVDGSGCAGSGEQQVAGHGQERQ